jgi:ribonuclease HII
MASARAPRSWLYFERRAYRQTSVRFAAGTDEVGRGCLAGPVVAAAVILPRGWYVAGIDDSKKLTPEERLKFFHVIRRAALGWSVAAISPSEIDRINILRASLLAMKTAVEHLQPKPDYLLIDGPNRIPELTITQRPLIAGDARSISIAAAAILAKVIRDRLMRFYSRRYPLFSFDKNKGYPTRFHRHMLKRHGPCEIHRKTFAGVIPVLQMTLGHL